MRLLGLDSGVGKRFVGKMRKLLGVMMVSSWRRALYRYGVAAGLEHRVVLKQLGDIKIVFDVGANRGQFALIARACFPDARIISFEPLPEPAAVFREVFAGDSLVMLHDVAIGWRAGESIMHVAQRDDSSSLLPITMKQTALFPGTSESDVLMVTVCPIDSCIELDDMAGPALLKIDVQGYELQALLGCENSLELCSWVYVECSFLELYEGQAFADEVIAWLRERGFVLCGVYNLTYDSGGRAVQSDLLFSKRA